MTDYRLDGLTSRTFEHFVQALAIKAMTETVTPFGDGPDGGREATFNGQTRYGVGNSKWDGSGVIQAKFLQRPTNAHSDGKWILKELRKELANYTQRPPDQKLKYYILATNVVLTPTSEGGSKDKVINELERFRRTHNLEGVDVWDYDKIRILLDNNKEVRQSYSAWILPGDILAELAESLKDQRPNCYRLLIRFLQKEMRADQYAKLEQAGHSADEAIPLSQVFIDLPVSSEPYSELSDYNETDTYKFADQIIREASQHCGQEEWRSTDEHFVGATGRHVLIGGPGQGKTTVGQYICQVFRAALLADVPNTAVDIEARKVSSAIQAQWEEGALARPGARRVPFRVVLSEFAKSLADGQATSLLSYLTHVFNSRTEGDLKVTQFEALLGRYPSIIILDGLDEVPASTNRNQVLVAIKDFWADVASSRIGEAGIDVLVVATSRPQGYNDDFSTKYYIHHWMIPLSPEVAITYGEKLAEVRFGQDTDRVAKVRRRIRRASENDSTTRLMRSPLQVTILTLLLDRMGQPPEERWPLFDEYFNLIYQREIERDIPAAAILRGYKADIVAVHRQVGLLLQVESERSGGTDARLTVDQFKEVVEHHLRDEGHQEDELASLTNSIMEAAANRLVFLVGLELGQVGFEIRSLQEFMAAEGIMAASDETTQKRLRAIAGNTNWRNVFLFAAGKCFLERRYLRDTIYTVCSELNDHPDDVAARATLAGSELALDVLQEGSVRRQPKWNRVLTRIALRILDDPSPEWAPNLAELWQSTTTDIFVEEIESRIEGTRHISLVNAWVCLTYLATQHGAEFDQMLINLLESHDIDHNLFGIFLSRGNTQSARLNRWIGDNAARYPASMIASAQNRRLHIFHPRQEIHHPRWDHEGSPEWLEPLTELARSDFAYQGERRMRLTLNNKTVGYLGRLAQIIQEPDIPETLKRVPTEGPEWLALRACIEFLLDPGKTNLAQALRETSRISTSPHVGLARVLPWPLIEAQRAARMSGRWLELADAAEAGLLGDLENWIDWQTDWYDAGITVSDFLDGDILNIGPKPRQWLPLRHLSATRSPFEETSTAEFVEQVLDGPPGIGRDALLRIVTRWGYGRRAFNQRLVSMDLPPRFLEAIFKDSWHQGVMYLSSKDPEKLVAEPWLSQIKTYSEKTLRDHIFLFSDDSRLSGVLEGIWEETGRSIDLLPALAQVKIHAQSEALIAQVSDSELEKASRNCRLAWAIIMVRTSRWSDRIARHIHDLIDVQLNDIMAFVQAIDEGGRPVVANEAVMLKLYDIAARFPDGSNVVIPALRACMKSRKSVLTNSNAWVDLGFPVEMSRLIQVES